MITFAIPGCDCATIAPEFVRWPKMFLFYEKEISFWYFITIIFFLFRNQTKINCVRVQWRNKCKSATMYAFQMIDRYGCILGYNRSVIKPSSTFFYVHIYMTFPYTNSVQKYRKRNCFSACLCSLYGFFISSSFEYKVVYGYTIYVVVVFVVVPARDCKIQFTMYI